MSVPEKVPIAALSFQHFIAHALCQAKHFSRQSAVFTRASLRGVEQLFRGLENIPPLAPQATGPGQSVQRIITGDSGVIPQRLDEPKGDRLDPQDIRGFAMTVRRSIIAVCLD